MYNTVIRFDIKVHLQIFLNNNTALSLQPYILSQT